MTTLAPSPHTYATRPISSDDLYHIYYDDPNISLCGLDISEATEQDRSGHLVCVVCAETEAHIMFREWLA